MSDKTKSDLHAMLDESLSGNEKMEDGVKEFVHKAAQALPQVESYFEMTPEDRAARFTGDEKEWQVAPEDKQVTDDSPETLNAAAN